jgi:hypothetical protein
MNADMIKLVWFLHKGLILPTGYKPTGNDLAILARYQAIIDDVNEAVADRACQSTVEKARHHGWHAFADYLQQLSDQDAFALFIRAREYGSERR